MKAVFVLAMLAAVVIADEKYTTENDDFDVNALVSNVDELKKFSGCFLDKNDCGDVAAAFKKDMPEAIREACAKCTDAQKHQFKTFLGGIKDKLPQEYEEFKKKYDPESKYFDGLVKAVDKF